MTQILVVNFYKFVLLEDYRALRESLLEKCLENSLKGTVLLAKEGINAALCGLPHQVKSVIDHIKEDSRFSDIELKESLHEDYPFNRMKVRLKKEIVSMGVSTTDPTKRVGTYVEPRDWNELISDPEVLVIDTRNDYEVEVGAFERATDPQTKSFRQFPEYVQKNLESSKDRKIAMYCTGGIRCEKATSYLKENGFENVFHLKGGILKYIEEVSREESLWRGECFVFDNRVALDHELEKGNYELCFACRHALSEEDLKSEKYCRGVFCPHCFDASTEDKRARMAERMKQIKLSQTRSKQRF